MARNEVYDDWEGFNSNSNHYDARKEKSYQARIWWILGIIGLGILISLVVRQVKDYRITQTYQCVEAEYCGENQVQYFSEDGVRLFYRIPSYPVKERNGKVLLYYENDSRYVETIGTFRSWLIYYLFFGAMTLLSGWRLRRIYRNEKHT